MRHMVLIATLMLLPAPLAADGTMGGKTIDCYCTDKGGGRVEIGEMTCLNVDGKSFIAQCQMSLNVPMWRKITDGCLTSALPQSRQPPPDAGLVDAHI